MDTYTFESERILKSVIGSGSGEYTTSTTKQGFSRHRTTVEDRSGAACAAIDWRERTFEIGGNSQAIEGLKRKVSNYTMTRYWRWQHGEEYKVRWTDVENAWTVTTSTGAVLASIHSFRDGGLLKPSVLPVLKLARSLAGAGEEEQRRFVLLVLLYSETRRLDRQD
ncbi:hypothetical protein C8R46DRAFT_1048407 [Mycena filopes]|nr:hypothetical protein C8R46DRAFT_1048407 [Mycena filopes]